MRCAHASARRSKAAFTLVEVMMAVLVVALMMISLFAGFSNGFAIMESAREDLRATQILLQQTEAVRLCTWSELTNVNFTASYDPNAATNAASGILYKGSITLSPATNLPVSAAYQTNMYLVTVSLTWTNYTLKRPVVHTREVQTQVARYGLQNYLWGAQ